MVYALEKIRHLEDKHLLAGHISLLNEQYSQAQNLFLSSSQPSAALDMRKSLLQWDHALKLAKKYRKDEVPLICREYAAQLEVKGDYEAALALYEKGLALGRPGYGGSNGVDDDLAIGDEDGGRGDNANASDRSGSIGLRLGMDDAAVESHVRICKSGVARMTLRIGNLNQGRALAIDSGDKFLMRECATILEQMKQFQEAADMYVRAECYEKGAGIFIRIKDFHNATPLMDKITTPKLHALYGKAKESEGRYKEAALAYAKAKDTDAVVRLNLYHLDNIGLAFNLVRKTRSPEGAMLVSEYCIKNNDIPGAIEFLLVARRGEDAFALAQTHNEMERYAQLLGDEGTKSDYIAIAVWYEGMRNFARAGHYYAKVEDYHKAMKLFLQCGDKCIDDAIELIKAAKGLSGVEALVRQLHAFLVRARVCLHLTSFFADSALLTPLCAPPLLVPLLLPL